MEYKYIKTNSPYELVEQLNKVAKYIDTVTYNKELTGAIVKFKEPMGNMTSLREALEEYIYKLENQ